MAFIRNFIHKILKIVGGVILSYSSLDPTELYLTVLQSNIGFIVTTIFYL